MNENATAMEAALAQSPCSSTVGSHCAFPSALVQQCCCCSVYVPSHPSHVLLDLGGPFEARSPPLSNEGFVERSERSLTENGFSQRTLFVCSGCLPIKNQLLLQEHH